MGQVTIYVDDAALEAAKRSAERSKVSVSQWFAKFAIEEKERQNQSWESFFAEIDRLHAMGGDDFPALEEIRGHSAPDAARETW